MAMFIATPPGSPGDPPRHVRPRPQRPLRPPDDVPQHRTDAEDWGPLMPRTGRGSRGGNLRTMAGGQAREGRMGDILKLGPKGPK